jgi:hypothetical protein
MRNYTVKRGECLAKIASDFGFADYRVIYDHPANAEFKRKRPNPHVIMAGDRIVIPDKQPPKAYWCETGKEHTFVMQRPSTRILLHVRIGEQPLANRHYILRIGTQRLPGQTGDDGLVDQPVPAWATRAELSFPEDNLTFDVKLGNLDPVTENSGVRQRLANLCLLPESRYASSTDGDGLDPATAQALWDFQVQQNLPGTSSCDEKTLSKLLEVHDKGVRS